MSLFTADDLAFLRHSLTTALKVGVTYAALYLAEQLVLYFCNEERTVRMMRKGD